MIARGEDGRGAARTGAAMRLSAAARLCCACFAVAWLFAGCDSRSTAPLAAIPPPQPLLSRVSEHDLAGSKIKHVVIIMQENRSFDNMFYGYPGADTATSGKDSAGGTIPLVPIPLEADVDINHFSASFFAACDGNPPGRHCKMDGFNNEGGFGSQPNYEYGYVPAAESAPYFAIAHQFVLADRMFTSHIDASFVSHQYIIAGQANNAVDLPTGAWGCNGGKADVVNTINPDRTIGPTESPCFNSQTIADELMAKNLTWRFYADNEGEFVWMSYQAIRHLLKTPQYKSDVVTPSKQFLTDVPKGKLASVTWITPTCATSDHSGCMNNEGPDWVASLVNTIGQSKFWDTTTVFILWDEWGGWYDHVPPPYVDFDGLGMRVPLIIVSPYAKKDHVSHVRYEHGSILKYIEDVFGLAPLAASDTRANSVDTDCFDYNHAPRAFIPIPSTLGPSYFINEAPDHRPIDDQ
jgi:phospholipase C